MKEKPYLDKELQQLEKGIQSSINKFEMNMEHCLEISSVSVNKILPGAHDLKIVIHKGK